MRFSPQRRMAGFSLVELVTVVAVAMIMTAVAIPTAITQYRQYRLTSTAVHVANFLQRCRYDAIRLNTNVACYFDPGQRLFWIDENGNLAADPTEPRYSIPDDLQLGPAGAPGPGSTNFPGALVPAAGVGPGAGITFTPRGGLFPAGSAYFFSIGYPAAAGSYGFRAITVSPVGKTKVWAASQNSNSWNDI